MFERQGPDLTKSAASMQMDRLNIEVLDHRGLPAYHSFFIFCL